MDDLDFSQPAKKPAEPAKKAAAPAAQPAAPAPAYNPAIARDFFATAGKEESLPAGAKIFAENEKASRILLKRDKMYLLLAGQVGLTAKGKPVGPVKIGEIFGEMAAISESPRSATAVAHTDVRVLSVDDKQLNAGLQSKPEFALMLMSIMINRLRGMISRLLGTPTASADAGKETRVFDKTMLAALAQGLGEQNTVRYDRGKVIMVQGQAGAFMYVVLEGRVAISLRGTVVERVGPGGVFGEMALVDQGARTANANAETDCALLAINRQVFLNLVKADPTFGVSLLTAIAERVRNTAAGLNN
jgi:CRP/FNR family transcriptional regulator, cyclic AMP receptor protein